MKNKFEITKGCKVAIIIATAVILTPIAGVVSWILLDLFTTTSK